LSLLGPPQLKMFKNEIIKLKKNVWKPTQDLNKIYLSLISKRFFTSPFPFLRYYRYMPIYIRLYLCKSYDIKTQGNWSKYENHSFSKLQFLGLRKPNLNLFIKFIPKSFKDLQSTQISLHIDHINFSYKINP
jgi:hypothetical protein